MSNEEQGGNKMMGVIAILAVVAMVGVGGFVVLSGDEGDKKPVVEAPTPDTGAEKPAVEEKKEDKKITFGVLPTKRKDTTSAEEQVEAFEKLLSAEAEGFAYDVKVVESYEALITALGAGTVDFALMDAGGGWLAYREAGARAVLAETADKDSDPFYQAVGFVNKQLFEGDWDHDGDRKTKAKAQICHIQQTKGRVSAHTSLTGSAGMIMPLGFMLQEKIINFDPTKSSSDTHEIDGLLAQWFGGYILGKGGAGGTHDVTASLPANFRDIHGNHYANAFFHAHKGNADVAFVSNATPTEKFADEHHSWTTTEMVTIQVRGEYPKDKNGAPDCKAIAAPEYREAHPDRFSFGKVPSHPIMAAKKVDAETEKAFVDAITKVNSSEETDLVKAWKGLYGKGQLTKVETVDHLKDIGERIELVPGIRKKVKGKKNL